MDVEAHVPTIEVRALEKEYRHWSRRVRALAGVDLTVERGEVFGLLGANGAGKTTLMKVLLGLTKPTAGKVRLRGENPWHATARTRVGYLPEGHRFPAYLSGEATLLLFGRLAGIDERSLATRAPALLDMVGLGGRGGDRIGRYSKGMTQRLGLAAALLDEPEVLFLDEPTDGVDPVGRRHIRDLLLEIRRLGTTIFINSHLLSEVERTCDRVCILHEGRVIRSGTVAELTASARRFRVRFGDPQPAEIAGLRAPGVEVVAIDGHVEVAAESLEALNLMVDRARAAGFLVAEITPLRSDLEDVFIATVAGTAPGGPGERQLAAAPDPPAGGSS